MNEQHEVELELVNLDEETGFLDVKVIIKTYHQHRVLLFFKTEQELASTDSRLMTFRRGVDGWWSLITPGKEPVRCGTYVFLPKGYGKHHARFSTYKLNMIWSDELTRRTNEEIWNKQDAGWKGAF